MTRLNGKTARITGSTDGVGRLVAKRLGDAGARVLVHGRSRERGEPLVAEIKEGGGSAEFLAADLSALAEVRRLAEAVQQRTDRLDILINNAGIGTGGSGAPRQTSADGHELRFAVNYLAGFLLTRLLLPLIKQSAPARIVNVASAGQQPIDFTDVMLRRGYSGTRAYCQSKLAQIMFTVDLADELHGTGVTVNALQPATYMDTTMVPPAPQGDQPRADQPFLHGQGVCRIGEVITTNKGQVEGQGEGWGGRPVRQEQAQGVLVATLGMLAGQCRYALAG